MVYMHSLKDDTSYPGKMIRLSAEALDDDMDNRFFYFGK